MIISPTKRVYIGQSIDIKRRLFEHKHDRREGCDRLKNSFRKYGFENHKVVILTECDKEDLCKFERYYQDLYSSTGEMGLNTILTPYDQRPNSLSDKQKRHLSRINKGRVFVFSDEERDRRINRILETKIKNGTIGKNKKALERERIRRLALELKEAKQNQVSEPDMDVSDAHRNVPAKIKTSRRSPQHSQAIVEARRRNGTYKWKPASIAKMIATRTGQKATAEHRANISKSLKGKKHTPDRIEKNSLGHMGQIPWNKGIPRTDSDKIKMVAGRIGKYKGEKSARSKLILNLDTGIYYFGCADAAESITHIKEAYLREMVGNKKRNKTAFIRA